MNGLLQKATTFSDASQSIVPPSNVPYIQSPAPVVVAHAAEPMVEAAEIDALRRIRNACAIINAKLC